MSGNKQPQLTHYFSPTMAADCIGVVSALHTDGSGAQKRVVYNISVYEGEGELPADKQEINEFGRSYLNKFQDAVKIGHSSQMDHRIELTRGEVEEHLAKLRLTPA